MTVGWLRASHRATDPALSTAWQPYHIHTAEEPLVPGQPYRVSVELRPTSLQLPAGYQLRLTISGHGPAHDDPADRPAALFDNTVTLHSGPDMPAHLLIPAVPPAPAAADNNQESSSMPPPEASRNRTRRQPGGTPPPTPRRPPQQAPSNQRVG